MVRFWRIQLVAGLGSQPFVPPLFTPFRLPSLCLLLKSGVANKDTIVKLTLASLGVLTLGALLSPINVHAQGRSFITSDAGFYWWVDGGAAIPQDGHLTEFGGLPSDQKVEYDVGGAFDLTMGYAFNRYFATELLIGGTWNSIDSVEGASANDTYFVTAPILANVVLQCPIQRTLIVPYLGAGVGGAATMLDTDGFYQPVPDGTVALYGTESDFAFAWQAFAGVRVDLNDSMSLGLGYRYLYVDASTYNYGSWYYGGPDLDVGLSSYEAHVVAITFRMKF